MIRFCIYASKLLWIVTVWSSIRWPTQVPENPDSSRKKNKENVFLHDIQGIFQQLENTIRPKMTQRMR